ncbi:hypothetical protein Achl_4495 (plasmid) [Pseudarthrobacter chlorophenolicus A6]|uniref:Uncharacterized protein n=1 Tax=Pseudarthrobacter chlorophenolicus (strain ATCC 700700 / DSM 12829 / CIP 107037 / JCM 12360 / KCTC 9906 / NCIMB 13794 / A6) TaxID=452863 RepID=B8HJ48_PSECP|nr:hypothetical protein [Pseudarthrobacter chlorophenolicus]ACL42446.1 hypothetical protein Achl_4495 [Pseudarthrobacter chlorophenolicus A6]SDQ09471.1 hypothetical protein SAMN04489738_0061 [Pseudarthrobacter chlorophenolicus]
MNEPNRTTENTAQTVVFLETLATLVEKSPESYSADASKDLAAHIRGMAEAVATDARVDPALLDTTRQYAALDWHNELVAVLFAPQHRPKMH